MLEPDGLPGGFPHPSPEPAPLHDKREIEDHAEHLYAENDRTRLHYAAVGERGGPLVVMVHGFPDFWYTWRRQMLALMDAGYRACAMDLRGYNASDKPEGIENYGMGALIGDVEAVIRAEGASSAIIVGHDWGGAIAWQFATRRPELTERLIVLNIPHLTGLTRELANDPRQREASAYTRFLQQPGAHESLSAERLARWVSEPEARERYVAAFEKSDFEAMIYYYRRHYPAEPYEEAGPPGVRVAAPVLQVHGLEDPYLFPGALAGTWDWVGSDLTLVTVPGAGHFVQQDAADLVSRTTVSWLGR